MKQQKLAGKKVLITAGATKEPIDPVRYITNNTNGELGYALAEAFLAQGATVYLVSGPQQVSLRHPNLTVVMVNTASEMYLACCRFFEEASIIIFGAAVADYRPKEVFPFKIKNQADFLTIKMVRNIDIAAAFSPVKRDDQIAIGFADETEEEFDDAFKKMNKKNLDILAVNTFSTDEFTFDSALKQVSVIDRQSGITHLEDKSKPFVVDYLVQAILDKTAAIRLKPFGEKWPGNALLAS